MARRAGTIPTTKPDARSAEIPEDAAGTPMIQAVLPARGTISAVPRRRGGRLPPGPTRAWCGGAAWLSRRLRGARRQQRCDLLRREPAPAAERQLAQLDVHDPHALQRLDRVAERLAHAADLAVQALGQD